MASPLPPGSGLSIRTSRKIARRLGVDHKTVGSVREEMETGGEIPHHDERVGADGVEQPATKPSSGDEEADGGGESEDTDDGEVHD